MTAQANVKTESSLFELAERCERAAGPDRELDCAIYNAIPDGPNRKAERLPMDKWGDRFDDGWRTMWADREDKWPDQLKRYTASLDAALTLVPKGMGEEIEITTLYQIARVGINLNHGPDDGPSYGENACNSIALALCAAALKAHAASPSQDTP